MLEKKNGAFGEKFNFFNVVKLQLDFLLGVTSRLIISLFTEVLAVPMDGNDSSDRAAAAWGSRSTPGASRLLPAAGFESKAAPSFLSRRSESLF